MFPKLDTRPSGRNSASQTALLAASQLHDSRVTNHQSLSLLESTLMKPPVSVARKELTGSLSLLDSTLMKNRGGGGVMVN